ncbi:MAG: glycosyltransferase family 4 protein [Bacteroidales bacterium]|jgi:glycosyltransferase involved in cell wall biosynthesis|nr:glycosyltransferase family 4 protein [Bacteroidales bacterium]
MKVLMFGWEFPPHIAGGLGTACHGIAKGLTLNGADVIFVMPRAFGDEDTSVARVINASEVAIDPRHATFYNQASHISFIEVNSKFIPYVGLDDYYNLVNQTRSTTWAEREPHKRVYRFAGGYTANLMQEIEHYAVVAEELARTETFDIIHAHDWHTYKAGIAAREVSGKPLVVHVHATEFDRSDEKHRNTLVADIEREGMMAADAVLAVSDFTRQRIIEGYHIPENKVFTIHNAVEPGQKEITRYKTVNEKIVTFLGRITFQKGPDYFVETARLLLQKDRNLRFVLAGDGDMMEQIIERVAELEISDRFHFTGFLRGGEINLLFGMSDVYVMPSVSEPFGISPLEAMEAGVPVVISKQSGVAEVLDYAIKVDFWDIEAMADAIHGILHYSALANFFAQNGTKNVQQLTWEKVGQKILRCYEFLTK